EHAAGALVQSYEPVVVERDTDRTKVAQPRNAERDQGELHNARNSYHVFREAEIPHADDIIASDRQDTGVVGCNDRYDSSGMLPEDSHGWIVTQRRHRANAPRAVADQKRLVLREV